jgi:hypothetical protein
LHLHGHETFDINKNELLGTIWEHIKKTKGGEKNFLVWNLAQRAKALIPLVWINN